MFKFTDWPKSKPTKIKYQVTLYRSLWWMIRVIALIGCYSHKLVVGNLVTVISLEKVLLRLYQQKKIERKCNCYCYSFSCTLNQ